ncbi:hypothetical protein [Algoriphagus sp. CAU 1675]|uniref:hypothetical protein n=1 Tax=Algoriphagus sp. CAU 1675 TaxID=3032597 RepID=UPI0023D980AA|nr:hypothetical protein [Algoriphagus sp. CAU 1675]MDF2158026.1 hypothetical protein [Algoriphagus sp. CAU 1675]
MARLIGLGGFSPQGKSGGFTFYQLNGQTIMRRLPASHRNKTNPTSLQLLYRQRFKEINAFLKPFKEVLNFGFQNQCTQSKRGTHCAYQELVQRGYTFGQEPRIDPSYLKISAGSLLGPEEVKATKENQLIRLTWRDPSKQGSSFHPAQVLVFLLHLPSGSFYWFPEAGKSHHLELSVEVKETDQDKVWSVYLAFYRKVNPKKIDFSDSVFVQNI